MFTSVTINLLTEKVNGSIPEVNILRLLVWFLKTEAMAIKP